MERIANALHGYDAWASVAFTAVILTKCRHILASTLPFCKWFDPLFCRLSLEKTLNELMDFAGVSLENVTHQGCARNSLLIEIAALSPNRGVFGLADNVGQGTFVDSRNRGQIVHKNRLPLWPLLLIFELARISGLTDRVQLFLLDFPNVSSIESRLKSGTECGAITSEVV